MQPIARTVQRVVWPKGRQSGILQHMFTKAKAALLFTTLMFPLFAVVQDTSVPRTTPEYSSEGQMKFPADYRKWVYLTSGFDMSYNPAMKMGHDMFDNVFVNPEAYKTFVETGSWPDKTVLVVEVRGAKDKGSINQKGHYQGESMGVEVHVKDEARFSGKWAFFGFDDEKTSKMIPTSAECYSCHSAHGAVDTTFVQFYPTLLPIATSKGTLSAAYQKESGPEGQK